MSTARLDTLPVASRSFTLPTGKTVSLAYVDYSPGSGFIYGSGFSGLRVDDYLSGRQKNSFPGYDPTGDNIRARSGSLDDRKLDENTEGSTSILDNFTEGIADTLDLGGDSVGGKVGTAIAWAVGIIVASVIGYFVWKALDKE